MKKTLIILYAVVAFSGCAYLGYIKDPFTDIPAFAKVNDAVLRGGQPREDGWKKLSSSGIKTIINLRRDSPATARERERAVSLGMNFIHIPLTVYEAPADDQVLYFLEVVLAPENQPVFVHCDSGRDRTGAMIAMYRVVVDGWTIKRAYREARQLGFWPYHGEEARLKAFVHQLKDKSSFFQKAQELIHANDQ